MIYSFMLNEGETTAQTRTKTHLNCHLSLFSYGCAYAEAVEPNAGTTQSIAFAAASPQQGDLKLSGPPSDQGAGGGARTRDRRVPADLRADSQATVLPTSPGLCWNADFR
ncbi:hypothetical protein PoB_007581100 [Plakobranchus ocellatus]|uniref:Uncharacterized protein n=1 Tax=Plakobranchus ocellatus TaxID=259542 RepID=A0AAV4DZN9_9GAST|nr:hypothetical protein PoB_007581100 [Plakobranchus ocellatus]